jgi:formylglycine-generating enzyme required for sulfatase activity
MNLVKLLRGSSWYVAPALCRSADRSRTVSDNAFNGVSFRVCCLPPLKTMSLPKLLRGGSWSIFSWGCCSAHRHRYLPVGASHYVGFRVVCLTAKKIPSQSFGKFLLSLCNLFNA